MYICKIFSILVWSGKYMLSKFSFEIREFNRYLFETLFYLIKH